MGSNSTFSSSQYSSLELCHHDSTFGSSDYSVSVDDYSQGVLEWVNSRIALRIKI